MSTDPAFDARFRYAMRGALGAIGHSGRNAAGAMRIGIAVSGGSDSMALMHLAVRHQGELGFTPVVLCFDHAIEGENSAAEFSFVRREAELLGLDFHGERANPPVEAGGGLSLEMAAREARRAFFARSAASLGLDAIATAHQRNDVAETLLLRLLRGAGAAGLSGLKPLSLGSPPVIRPLLDFSRAELRTWLKADGMEWMDDVANSNEAIPRCRVRLTLIPEIARIMGRTEDDIAASLAQSAAILRDEDDYLGACAEKALQCATQGSDLALEPLATEHPAVARRTIRKWLAEAAGFHAAGFSEVDALLSACGDSSVNLPGGATIDVGRERVAEIRHAPEESPGRMALPMPGRIRWGRFTVTAAIASSAERRRETPGCWPTACTISLRAIEESGSLEIRSRMAGDRIEPYGMEGSRKLQDVLVDMKIPARKRDSYPVVAAGEHIAWIPGYRIAAPFAASGDETTVRITVEETAP